jgi:hypothetical protein
MFSEADDRLSLLATCNQRCDELVLDTNTVRPRQAPFLGVTHVNLAVRAK